MDNESPKPTNIDTGGGSSIGSDVNTGGGQFVGRDHVEIKEVGNVHVYPGISKTSVITGIILGPIVWLLLLIIIVLLFIPGLTSIPKRFSENFIATPVVNTLTNTVSIEQVRLSYSENYLRLDVTTKNPHPYEVLVKRIGLSGYLMKKRVSCATGSDGSGGYIISDEITLSNTKGSLEILGAVYEGISPFQYPLTGTFFPLCGGEGIDIGFETSLLLPAAKHTSFDILIPRSLKLKRAKLVQPNSYDLNWLLLDSDHTPPENTLPLRDLIRGSESDIIRNAKLTIQLDSQHLVTTNLDLHP